MITVCGKQVLVQGINDTGDVATVQYLRSARPVEKVLVTKLRSDTIQELQDALIDAPVLTQ